MDGEDLSVIFDGKEPGARSHFTLGYHDHVRALDRGYAMISRNDGSDPVLYDLDADPEMRHNVAYSNPDVVRRMWNDYVLEDAGGPPPLY
jgi:hypothetical protein